MNKAKKIEELEKSGAKLPRRAVSRRIQKRIIPWMERDDAIIITGARQTGKSVLLYQLIYDYLLPKTSDIYYFNLDVPNQLKFFDSPDRLIELANKSKGKVYLFIDEVQRLKEPGLFLKGLYDLHLPLKIIASGSSALEIKSRVHEALTGRKILFHLSPFSMEELSDAIFPGRDFSRVSKNKEDFRTLLNHYMIYGGYPAVALARDKKIKLQLLNELFRSYMDKDVKAFLKVENENAFRNLIKILSSQIGNLINKDELSNSLGIHKNTLDNYLFYLEQTFILDFVRPFYRNPRKELLKNPKVYFCDQGLRNFAIENFGDFEFRPDKGSLFENSAYLCLKEQLDLSPSIYFWRTKSGAEVDFVIAKGLQPVPIEVKAASMGEYKVSKSMRSFLQAYHPEKAYCINLSLKGQRTVEKTNVSFLTLEELSGVVRQIQK